MVVATLVAVKFRQVEHQLTNKNDYDEEELRAICKQKKKKMRGALLALFSGVTAGAQVTVQGAGEQTRVRCPQGKCPTHWTISLGPERKNLILFHRPVSSDGYQNAQTVSP